mgnify:CR=1 FL=1
MTARGNPDTTGSISAARPVDETRSVGTDGSVRPDGRVSATWLGLREAADAAARSPHLVELVGRHLAGTRRTVIHDLGAGTGSMGRWLAPSASRA